MMRALWSLMVFAMYLLVLAQPAMAVPGDMTWVTDVEGSKVQLQDGGDDPSTFAMIAKAYQAAYSKGEDINDILLVLIRADDYEKYASDSDMEPFITVAKVDHYSAVVFFIPSYLSGRSTHAALFKDDETAFYATGAGAAQGNKPMPFDVRESLTALPEKALLKGAAPEGVMRLRSSNFVADSGPPLTAYRIVHVQKDEIPWTFDNTKNPAPLPAKPPAVGK
jgi:hypothetical protein